MRVSIKRTTMSTTKRTKNVKIRMGKEKGAQWGLWGSWRVDVGRGMGTVLSWFLLLLLLLLRLCGKCKQTD